MNGPDSKSESRRRYRRTLVISGLLLLLAAGGMFIYGPSWVDHGPRLILEKLDEAQPEPVPGYLPPTLEAAFQRHDEEERGYESRGLSSAESSVEEFLARDGTPPSDRERAGFDFYRRIWNPALPDLSDPDIWASYRSGALAGLRGNFLEEESTAWTDGDEEPGPFDSPRFGAPHWRANAYLHGLVDLAQFSIRFGDRELQLELVPVLIALLHGLRHSEVLFDPLLVARIRGSAVESLMTITALSPNLEIDPTDLGPVLDIDSIIERGERGEFSARVWQLLGSPAEQAAIGIERWQLAFDRRKMTPFVEEFSRRLRESPGWDDVEYWQGFEQWCAGAPDFREAWDDHRGAVEFLSFELEQQVLFERLARTTIALRRDPDSPIDPAFEVVTLADAALVLHAPMPGMTEDLDETEGLQTMSFPQFLWGHDHAGRGPAVVIAPPPSESDCAE